MSPITLGGEKLTRCPLRPFYENPLEFTEVFEGYRLYNKGFMPEDGGYNNQPNAWLESCLTMESSISELESDKLDTRKKADEKTAELRKMGFNPKPKGRK